MATEALKPPLLASSAPHAPNPDAAAPLELLTHTVSVKVEGAHNSHSCLSKCIKKIKALVDSAKFYSSRVMDAIKGIPACSQAIWRTSAEDLKLIFKPVGQAMAEIAAPAGCIIDLLETGKYIQNISEDVPLENRDQKLYSFMGLTAALASLGLHLQASTAAFHVLQNTILNFSSSLSGALFFISEGIYLGLNIRNMANISAKENLLLTIASKEDLSEQLQGLKNLILPSVEEEKAITEKYAEKDVPEAKKKLEEKKFADFEKMTSEEVAKKFLEFVQTEKVHSPEEIASQITKIAKAMHKTQVLHRIEAVVSLIGIITAIIALSVCGATIPLLIFGLAFCIAKIIIRLAAPKILGLDHLSSSAGMVGELAHG